jgi:hypothetical protein
VTEPASVRKVLSVGLLNEFVPQEYEADYIMGSAAMFVSDEHDNELFAKFDLSRAEGREKYACPLRLEEDITSYYLGIGLQAAFFNADKKIRIQVEEFDPANRIPFVEGYGLGMAFKYGNDQKALAFYSEGIIAPEYRNALDRGMKRLESWISVQPK